MYENDAMEERAAYLRRGRHLKDVSTDQIRLRWTDAFRALVHQQTPINITTVDDLGAELKLRDVELPWETVEAELAEARRQIIAEGPDNPGVRAHIRRFMDALNQPKH
jgi:hypothetical protein